MLKQLRAELGRLDRAISTVERDLAAAVEAARKLEAKKRSPHHEKR